MQEVKILRLTTGEDVIAKVGENDQGVSLKQAFVIIPQQAGPGKPIQLMMSLYNAFGKSETITLAKDKIVFISAIAPVKDTEMLLRNIKILNNVSEALKGKLFNQDSSVINLIAPDLKRVLQLCVSNN